MLDKTARVTTWTPDRRQTVIDLWGKISAREIAEKLGGVSKSAVIGYAHRLSLALDEDKHWSAEDDAILTKLWSDARTASYIATQVSRRADGGSFLHEKSIQARARRLGLRKRERSEQSTPSNRQRKPPRPAAVPVIDLDIPQEQRRAFLELEGHQCRWPVGEPEDAGFFFCAAVKLEDSSYCAGHHARAYTNERTRGTGWTFRRAA
jgi:GcrA cell cycle regulator